MTLHFQVLEPRATIESQLSDTEVRVVLLNVFTLGSWDAVAFLRTWSAETEFFKKQPGHISMQLHQVLVRARCM